MLNLSHFSVKSFSFLHMFGNHWKHHFYRRCWKIWNWKWLTALFFRRWNIWFYISLFGRSSDASKSRVCLADLFFSGSQILFSWGRATYGNVKPTRSIKYSCFHCPWTYTICAFSRADAIFQSPLVSISQPVAGLLCLWPILMAWQLIKEFSHRWM